MSVATNSRANGLVKIISWLVLVLYVTGCSSMQPVEMSQEELRESITAGEVFAEGKNARIFTEDETEHRIKVREVTDDMVIGEQTEVPIEEIVAVETKQFSGGRTLLLGAAYVGVMYFIALAVAPAAILAGGA